MATFSWAGKGIWRVEVKNSLPPKKMGPFLTWPNSLSAPQRISRK